MKIYKLWPQIASKRLMMFEVEAVEKATRYEASEFCYGFNYLKHIPKTLAHSTPGGAIAAYIEKCQKKVAAAQVKLNEAQTELFDAKEFAKKHGYV